MLVAASATAVSTYLHWLPCRGAMLNGSVLKGFTYPVDFSDACLRRMDTGLPFPYPDMSNQSAWAPELGVVATVLLAVAWLILVLSRPWAVRTKLVAVLTAPALLVMAMCAVAAIRGFHRPVFDSLWSWVSLAIDVAAAAAIVAVCAWEGKEGNGYAILQFVVAAWGLSAFGLVHKVVAYLMMGTFSAANWDTPPGTGYLSVAVMVLAALGTVALTLCAPSTSENEPEPRGRRAPARA